jgi:hypothetical protein
MIEVRFQRALSWIIPESQPLYNIEYFWQANAPNFFCISDFTLVQQFAHKFL